MALAVVLLTNFDIMMILRNIVSSCKVVKSFLTAENQDFRKSCKMQNFTIYNFF